MLDLSILTVENGVASPFQLCGIVVPKLVCTHCKQMKILHSKSNFQSVHVILQVKNVDRTDLSDEEKLELTIDILKITQGIYKYTKHTCLQKVLLVVLRLGLRICCSRISNL